MIRYILILQHLKINGGLLNFIVKNFDKDEMENLINGGVLDLQFKYGVFDDENLDIFYNIHLLNETKKYVEDLIKTSIEEEIKIISFYDDDYPESLRNISNSPIILYAKGNLDLLKNEKIVACVGTRTPSELTVKKIKESIEIMAESNIVIASGLALGVDAFSHQYSVNNGAKTIAILANGLESIYPKKNNMLANEILQKDGLLISEYSPKSNIQKSNFVERNRLISGISKGVIVFEAEEKSGTMHTAKFALKQKKAIYCPVLETTNSSGVMKLIESKRAKPFYSVKTVIEDIFPEKSNLININFSINQYKYEKFLQIVENTTSMSVEEFMESLIDKTIEENEMWKKQ